MKDVNYNYSEELPAIRATASLIAQKRGWDEAAAAEMTDALSPASTQELVKLGMCVRNSDGAIVSAKIVDQIYNELREEGAHLGVPKTKFEYYWEEAFGEQLEHNPALAYHMLITRAYNSAGYGSFVFNVRECLAEAMLFTHGIVRRIDGKLVWVEDNDPSKMWCDHNPGCRFNRDRGEMMLEHLMAEVLAHPDSEGDYVILSPGAGYMTELVTTGKLKELAQSGKQVTIYACDQDETICLSELMKLCELEARASYHAGTDTVPPCWLYLLSKNVRIQYYATDMLTLVDLVNRGEKPRVDFVLVKGLFSYHLKDGQAKQFLEKLCESGLVKNGTRLSFDLQTMNLMFIREGLVFGWAPMDLLELDEAEDWTNAALNELGESYKLAFLSESGIITNNFGPMTYVVSAIVA